MDGGGAWIAGAGERADDPLAVEGGAEAFVGHVPFDDVGDRGVEQDLDQLGIVAQSFLEFGAGRRGAEPGVGRLAVVASEGPPDAAEERLVGQVAVDIAGRDLGHAGRGPGRVVPQDERGAVVERAPQVRVDRLHPVAPPPQAELLDDQRVEQPDEVGAGAHHESLVGERRFQRARPSELAPPLEHQHRPPGPGQVGGGGQPVVARPDDDHVPRPAGGVADRRRHGPAVRNSRIRPFTLAGSSRWRKWPTPGRISTSRPPGKRFFSSSWTTSSAPMQPSSAPWR